MGGNGIHLGFRSDMALDLPWHGQHHFLEQPGMVRSFSSLGKEESRCCLQIGRSLLWKTATLEFEQVLAFTFIGGSLPLPCGLAVFCEQTVWGYILWYGRLLSLLKVLNDYLIFKLSLKGFSGGADLFYVDILELAISVT